MFIEHLAGTCFLHLPQYHMSSSPNGSSLMKCSMHALRGVFLAAGAGPKFRFSY